MKRNYLIGSVAILTAMLGVSQTILSPKKKDSDLPPESQAVSLDDFPTHPAKNETELAEGWYIINNNDDTVTWETINDYNTNQAVVKSGYTLYGGGSMDDFLVSPAVVLEAGKTYNLILNYKIGGWVDKDNLAVYLSSSLNPEEIKVLDPIFKIEDAYISDYSNQKITLTPAETGEYHLVFHCYSSEYQSGVWISEVRFVDNIAPSPVTDLVITANSDHSIGCTLSWTLPTTDILGDELIGENAIEKIIIYRDSEFLIELPANTTSYMDNEDSGLTPGKHTYSVIAVANGIESEPSIAESPRIGPAQAIALPSKITFDSDEDFEEWKVLRGEESTVTQSWTFNSSRNYASFSLGYWTTDDDWLISPSVKVDEAGYFKVNLLGVMTSGSEGKFTLAKGDSPTIESMETFSSAFALPLGDAWTTDFPETGYDIYLEPGTYYFGIHNKLGKNNPSFRDTYSYYVKGLNIIESSYTPGKITNLSAKGADDMSSNLIVSWTNPIIDKGGQSMEGKEFAVKVYVNDNEEPSAIITDGSETCTIPVNASGTYDITVIVETPDGEAASEPVTIKSGWVGSPEVELPYSTSFNKNTDPFVEIWESFVIDGNKDGKQFYLNSEYYGQYFTIQGGTGDYKDFILSPYFNLPSGNYKISFSMCGAAGYNIIPVVVGYTKGGTFNGDDYASNIEIILEEDLDDYDGYNLSCNIKIEEEDYYQIVFGEVGNRTSDYGELQLSQFSIEELTSYPSNVSDLTVISNPNDDETAIISWINPSTIYGTETPLNSIESIVIKRDGEIVGTITENLLPGKPGSFIDRLPSGGKYTYTVYATLNGKGHGERYATVESSWIGGGIAAPVSMDANDERWTIIDTYGDFESKGSYSVNGWYQRNDLLWYLHDSYNPNPADDYLLTPPVKIKSNEIYKISFMAEPNGWAPSKNYVISVKMGTSNDYTSLEEVSAIEIPEDASNNDLKEYSFYVKASGGDFIGAQLITTRETSPTDENEDLYQNAVQVPEGSHTIALHAQNNGGGLRIGSFNFEKVADVDISTGIDVVCSSNTIRIEEKTIIFSGEEDINIYTLSGVCVASAERCENTFSLENLTPGYYIINVGPKSFKILLK